MSRYVHHESPFLSFVGFGWESVIRYGNYKWCIRSTFFMWVYGILSVVFSFLALMCRDGVVNEVGR
jgi:hypothetical protein